MKAILLVGGLGTRLRSVVPSLPKPLASIGDRPFLELLVQQLNAQGIVDLLMCTGYLAEQIEEEFGDGSKLGSKIQYSKEAVPLGTAGALKLARKFVQDDSEFLVLNGDSFAEVDFHKLFDFHRKRPSLLTMAVVRVPNASRYGTVEIGVDGRVLRFVEKTGRVDPGMINAGVYVFDSAVIGQIAEGASSLEREIFPRLLEQGVYALEQPGLFIDIGTPEDYERAQRICDRLSTAALNKQ